MLRAVFLSWKRAAEDSRNRLALTEKFIAQKYRKQQTQLRKDCLLAWNAHAQMLKQTRVEQMKRAVVERAIADESETHYGTAEGIAIVQAAKRFQRRNFLERVASLVFQRWREESAKRNDVFLALKSAFIEENEARRLRAAFRVCAPSAQHGGCERKAHGNPAECQLLRLRCRRPRCERKHSQRRKRKIVILSRPRVRGISKSISSKNARNLNLINAATIKTKSPRKMTSFLVPITRTIGIFTTRVATVNFLP